jgi:hypothetical protein
MKTFRCNQCEAAMINGIFCHETGCPNRKKRYNKTDDVWETMITCRNCGYDFVEGESCCE